MRVNEVTASLRRHWSAAVIVLALIPLVMMGYLVNRDIVRPPDRYTTSADLLIPARDEATGDPPEGIPPVLLQGQRDLALSSTTRERALRGANVDPAEDHGIQFDAQLSSTGTIMTLAVAAPQPELAATVLSEYVKAFAEGRRESVFQSAIEAQDVELRFIGSLTRRIAEVEFQLSGLGVPLTPVVPDGEPVVTPPGTSNSTILLAYERNTLLNELQRRLLNYSIDATQAQIPAAYNTVVQRRSTARITPPPPSPAVTLLEILAAGLALAVAIPVLLDRLDSTITEGRTAPRALRARLLATIPQMPRRLRGGYAPAGSTWDDAFRTLAATSISTDQLPKAIMVTSPTGSTQDTVAANFAAGLARLGATVVLVGTVPRQDWFLDQVVDVEEPDLYVDIDAEADDVPGPAPTTGPDVPAPWESREGRAATMPEPVPAADETGAAQETLTRTLPVAVEDRAPMNGGSRRAALTFPELLEAAHAGRLGGDLRARLARSDVENLYVVPPGEHDCELTLHGLPPLLEALSRSDIDVTVVAGPALLEAPNATIIAWSTRHVLWALEVGRVKTRDAQLAADRLELGGVAPFGIAVVQRNA